MSTLLVFENVSKSFPGFLRPSVLKDVSFGVEAGQFVAITGPSGQGKSTLLSIAAGLLPPDGGRVLFNGESLYDLPERQLDRLRSRDVALMFQKPKAFAALTASENLCFALKPRFGRDAQAKAAQALESYGLAEVTDSLPSQLSFGQLRRLAIARTLALEPKVLLADEPTNDLDTFWCEQVMADLQAFAGRGGAVVMVTHDTRYMDRASIRFDLGEQGLVGC